MHHFFIEEMDRIELLVENFGDFRACINNKSYIGIKLLLPMIDPNMYMDDILIKGDVELLNYYSLIPEFVISLT